MPSWIGSWSEWRRDLAVAVVLGLFLGVLGPFGSFLNGSLALRMAYWSAMLVVGVLLYGFGLRWALHVGARLQQPDWFVFPLALAVLAVPMSLITRTVDTAIWPSVTRYVKPFDWYAQVLVISAPLNLLWLWGRRVSAGQIAAPHQPAQTPVAALEQLPLRLGQRLICLQMEDHYVRVHTDTGSELVLSPLKDAIDALSGVDGLQVHRSWWVAREAVVRPLRRGRQVELELANGLRAPVSRASIARLKAAGWLTADDA